MPAPLSLTSDELAARVSASLLAIFKSLEDTIGVVDEQASPDESRLYRQAIGQVCGALVLDVMGPLYEAHPSVKPASWN